MNFLAHIYLSGENTKLLMGNFIADFVKGKNALELFDPDVQKGIYLHRTIDAFTDTHAVVHESKARLRPKYRHYAGVIVDVFYDHFLARNWNNYHHEPLADFSTRTYQIIQRHQSILPERVKAFFPYMVRGNWLLNYSQVEGIARALTGMSRRTPYESKMDEAVNELVQYYNQFNAEFELFFPDLKDHVKNFTL
jgi:acyl carrier protein phosphodiesterase